MAGWHQSRSDPRKVYDAYHQPVGVMHSAEQAALIVEAVNALGPERYNSIRKEAREISQSTGAPEQVDAPVSLTQTYQEDECCGKHIAKAIRAGTVGVSGAFTCPKCGCEWSADQIGERMFHWTPRPIIEVFR
jgi:hypothetical protein